MLNISDNRRFLVRGDGRPFFWLGDTAWELFHRLTREQIEYYLRRRVEQGFTVIQAVALAELDGLNSPNAYGDVPLIDGDPVRPFEPYWQHVDWAVQAANALRLTIGFLPTWGSHWHSPIGQGGVFTPDNAEIYGRWLGERYRDADLVWILGGDRNPENELHRQIIRRMAKGLHEGDGGRHLRTFHPRGASGSAELFHDEPWLDFNMRQNGHVAEFTDRYDQTAVDYGRRPIKPVIDGEPTYEDHPLNFDATRWGYSTAADIRRPLYWDLFQGAFGHTYGHNSVWQFWDESRTLINHPHLPWREALEQPGAAQMQHTRRLLESRPFLSRIPDDTLIVADRRELLIPGAGRYRFVATRDSENSYAMVYAPVSRSFSVRLNAVAGAVVRAWWFDPRDGSAAAIGDFPADGVRRFDPPSPGELLDWVLVLDDAAKNFGPPGTRLPLEAQ